MADETGTTSHRGFTLQAKNHRIEMRIEGTPQPMARAKAVIERVSRHRIMEFHEHPCPEHGFFHALRLGLVGKQKGNEAPYFFQ